MEIEKIKISFLSEDPNNSRKHGAKNLAAIKGSLAKFGQQKPIVIDKNNVVIAGNGTLRAAIELGWAELDIVRTELEGFNASAFALADNKTAELASWDYEALQRNLDDLKAENFDITSIGFEELHEEIKNTTKELDEEQFSEFNHTCPKCGFEFNMESK